MNRLPELRRSLNCNRTGKSSIKKLIANYWNFNSLKNLKFDILNFSLRYRQIVAQTNGLAELSKGLGRKRENVTLSNYYIINVRIYINIW